MIPTFNGLRIVIVDSHLLPAAQVWTQPGRVPSKAAGRRGTRRAWKRAHPPRLVDRPDLPRQMMRRGDALYVDQIGADRLKAAARDLGTRMTARAAGKTAAAFEALGFSAAKLSAALPPLPEPEPEGWYGAVDAGWDFDGQVVRFGDGYAGVSVEISYQLDRAGEKIDAAFGAPAGYGRSAIDQALAPIRMAETRRRFRAGRASAPKVRVICPA